MPGGGAGRPLSRSPDRGSRIARIPWIGARIEAASFRRRLGPPARGRPLIGVEQEFGVWHAERQVDFRSVIHGLGLGRRHLDPDDPNAYRLPSGAVVTCDGAEAEIALAPAEIGPGFGRDVARATAQEQARLQERLPAGYELRGYSTHISVEVPEALAVAVAKRYVTTFGPAMMLAMDGPDRPGLRVRPRHRRLELCGDFVAGRRLREALELGAGSVAATLAEIERGLEQRPLPPPVEAAIRPAIERPGWFIDRVALGLGRNSEPDTLHLSDGGRTTVKRHVGLARASAKAALAEWLTSAASESAAGGTDVGGRPRGQRPFGDVLRTRRRPNLALAPVMVTWPLNVFIVAATGSRRPAFAVVPREWLGAFLDEFDRGDLDSILRGYAGARRLASRAGSWRDAREPGLYDDLPSRARLLPPEPM